MITVGLAIMLSASLAIAANRSVSTSNPSRESSEPIRTLEEAYADLAFGARVADAPFREQIEVLQARVRRQEAAIAELTSAKASFERELRARERELARLTRKHGDAHAVVDSMEQAISRVEDLLGEVVTERSLLRERLKVAERELVEVSGERDAKRRVEVGLRWQLAHLEDEVERLRTHRESTQMWLKDWVLGSVEALEDLVDETGVDVEKLIVRAANELPPGQGGPLQVAAPDAIGSDPAAAVENAISGDIQRLALLQRIARSLPLTSPLDQFYVTSPYGKRRDPFTKTWAYHSGLDLGAPRNSVVLATAPGQVTFAGPSGPYGNLVEVDHGMGIVTSYAHLKSVDVEVGHEVEFRRAIGVIGNTGRSTSRHLHYEIRIDGRPFDPTRFLDAGRQMVGLFDASGRRQAQ